MRERLKVPVISVGNITCGGTGKTPVVEMLVRDLLARGRHPAILSRGYRAGPDGLGDEARMLEINLPGVPHYTGRDRICSGRKATGEGADVLVLDDGFQYARLARDLDIVLIDSLDPFGGGRVLPGGLLRERLQVLRGADLFAITRGALVSPSRRGVLGGLLRDRYPGIPRLEIETDAVSWERIPAGGSLDLPALTGKRMAAFAGIGNPEAFRRQLLQLGVRIALWLPFPDHHSYSPSDLQGIERKAREAGAQVVVTTQKDAVKLNGAGGISSASGLEWFALKILCRPGKGSGELVRALDRVLVGGEVRG